MAVNLALAIIMPIAIIILFVILFVYYNGPLQTFKFIGVILLLACVSLPPVIGALTNSNGGTYSFQDYSSQIFLPVILGFLGLFFILPYTFDINSIEPGIIIICSASILFSLLSFAFIVQRIRFTGI